MHPGKEFWKYRLEDQIKAFADTVGGELYSNLPMTIESVETHPQIFGFDVQALDDNYYPVVLYLTKTPLTDLSGVKQEFEKIKPVVNRTFPGINIGKKYVFYRAFNTLPEGNVKPNFYMLIDEGNNE